MSFNNRSFNSVYEEMMKRYVVGNRMIFKIWKWFPTSRKKESRAKPNTNEDIQLFEDQVNHMKEKTKAKLQQSVQLLNEELSQLKQDHEVDTEPLNKQIRQLQVVVKTKEKDHKSKVEVLKEKIKTAQKDLDGFERTSSSPTAPTLDKEFECPVCFEMMGPPKQIFQCSSGHLICGFCKTRGNFRTCPVCRIPVRGEGNFTRSLPMERIIRTYLEKKSK